MFCIHGEGGGGKGNTCVVLLNIHRGAGVIYSWVPAHGGWGTGNIFQHT